MDSHTLVSLLRQRAETSKDQPVYTLLTAGQVVDQLSFATLHAHAAAVAAQLAQHTAPGDRVLILCPPGLDYIRAFFGCLVSGRVAVPAYPPRNNRYMLRLRAILDDSLARCILTTRELRERIRSALDERDLARAAIAAVDEADLAAGRDWEGPALQQSEVAFLQYTSGTTGSPNGVMVTHRNLMANSAMMQDAFKLAPGQVYVSWLPLFHDMGLMAMVQGVFSGAHEVILSPLEFISRPFRWLEAISAYRASLSGGPNFAYELCASRITDDECQALDLSSWRLAFNGSEPVQAETLERFTRRFQGRGFRHQAHYACYGLAEATLFVSGAALPRDPVVKALSRSALAEGDVRAADASGSDTKLLVGCGQAFRDEVIRIVHPEHLTLLPEGRLGEIWVSGEAVGAGYWRNAQATADTFEATLPDEPGGRRYLRTGDLGFFETGELYVAGRLKDLIIVRGQNYYPQDIEGTAQRSHPALVTGGGAAFEGSEGVVLVQEVLRTARNQPMDEVIAAIKEAVVETLGLELSQVVLVLVQSIPRTSSGKIQRRQTRQLFLDHGLKRLPGANPPASDVPTGARGAPTVTRAALEGALRSIVAHVLKQPFILIDPKAPLSSLGLDDAAARSVSERIHTELGVDLPEPPVASSTVGTLVDSLLVLLPGAHTH
jgi:acyl-CoA synthetase (AMP-forming)/AMP-acid ligase II